MTDKGNREEVRRRYSFAINLNKFAKRSDRIFLVRPSNRLFRPTPWYNPILRVHARSFQKFHWSARARGIVPALIPPRFPFISQSAVSIIGLSGSPASFRGVTKRVTTTRAGIPTNLPRDFDIVLTSENGERDKGL